MVDCTSVSPDIDTLPKKDELLETNMPPKVLKLSGSVLLITNFD